MLLKMCNQAERNLLGSTVIAGDKTGTCMVPVRWCDTGAEGSCASAALHFGGRTPHSCLSPIVEDVKMRPELQADRPASTFPFLTRRI